MHASVTARDFMNPRVLFVYEDWSINRLASFFKSHKISGAPVVSADHGLVGVVSVTDVFNFENMDTQGKAEALQRHFDYMAFNGLELGDLTEWAHKAENNCTVHQIMSNDVISVSERASFTEVCRVLRDSAIHRVFVLDRRGLVCGVISSTDIFRYIVDGAQSTAEHVA